jgi:hypothetical protein
MDAAAPEFAASVARLDCSPSRAAGRCGALWLFDFRCALASASQRRRTDAARVRGTDGCAGASALGERGGS